MLRNRINPGAFYRFFYRFLPVFGMLYDGMADFLLSRTLSFRNSFLVWFAPDYPPGTIMVQMYDKKLSKTIVFKNCLKTK
jgi:hypothetical protein